jgi:carbonic anhydrase/acetyltransferase-like protein (isoleucine patch superfamily)
MASSKRQSVLPRGQVGPKAPVNFSSSITISDTAILTGNHTINVSSDSVIHPRARFDSTKGRVTVGRRCIIHERTHIGASEPNQPSASFGVLMDDFVTIEVSAIIESGETTIGEGTVIGIGAKIGRGAKIGKVCREKRDTSLGAKSVAAKIHPSALHNHCQEHHTARRDGTGQHSGIRQRLETIGQTRYSRAQVQGTNPPD